MKMGDILGEGSEGWTGNGCNCNLPNHLRVTEKPDLASRASLPFRLVDRERSQRQSRGRPCMLRVRLWNIGRCGKGNISESASEEAGGRVKGRPEKSEPSAVGTGSSGGIVS